jgi:hypothetical protein
VGRRSEFRQKGYHLGLTLADASGSAIGVFEEEAALQDDRRVLDGHDHRVTRHAKAFWLHRIVRSPTIGAVTCGKRSSPVKINRRDLIAGAAGAAGVGAGVYLLRPTSDVDVTSQTTFHIDGSYRLVESNGLPGHELGDFPNRHNPIPVASQSHKLRLPLQPVHCDRPIPINMWWFGIALNGVPFDPSGPYWNGDVSSGWQFEVLHPANSIALGIDRNNAHTQVRGVYHYHGLPDGLLAQLISQDPTRRLQLVGYAADGYPIYGPECPESPEDLASPVRRLRSSYRLADTRHAKGPRGKPDGRFVEDYLYDPEHGDLDECNGRIGPTPEFPDGTYHYVLTDGFPFIPRCYRGVPDRSFEHGPPPGVSAPLPAELRHFRGA